VKGSLDELARVAESDENLIWALVECARAECTLGEMVEALRGPFGTYRESPSF
jgi:methylmalonyl-CoA mutase N-terminal domain/subunit